MTEGKVDYVAKMENFSNDMANILNKIDSNIFVINNVKNSLSKKYNHSVHDQYRKYYTDKLRDMVIQWDNYYIKKFNYKF